LNRQHLIWAEFPGNESNLAVREFQQLRAGLTFGKYVGQFAGSAEIDRGLFWHARLSEHS